MMHPDEYNSCPHCGADLQGDPIPEDIRHHYGNATHFRREMGVEITGKYDGVWYYECPDCQGTWGGRRELVEQFKKRNSK